MLPYKVIEQRLQAAVKAVLPDADTSRRPGPRPAPTRNSAITRPTP